MSKDNPSILILDTYYPEFLKSAPLLGNRSYEEELDALMKRCYGTYDCYSRGLTTLGWETEDVVMNHLELLRLSRYWNEQLPNHAGLKAVTCFPVKDVVFYQDLNLCKTRPGSAVVAGQISCTWPGDDVIRRFDILFTSFPHYVPRIQALGVKAVYVPLAFDPIVYERLPKLQGALTMAGERLIDVSFVGGIGTQWGDRAETICKVRDALGHKFQILTYSHNSRDYFPVWGVEMYQTYKCSKIVLNTHHPAAQGYSNNLRMFEATGMGAMLLTECAPNIEDFFELGGDHSDPDPECSVYESPEHAVELIEYYLEHDDEREEIAKAGQARTLRSHTYLSPNRLPVVDRELRTLLESKKGTL